VILSLIVAMSEGGIIGHHGKIPWHLPDDLRRFKQLTMGHPLIMGRRTFASIGHPLPGRRCIVLSRDPAFRAEGVETAPDLDTALARVADAPEAFVSGGAEVYRAALPRADRLYLTLVHAPIPGDVRFPTFDHTAWTLVEETLHPADAHHAHAFSFLRYERHRAVAHSA
jgi:dihydrofolate reductase